MVGKPLCRMRFMLWKIMRLERLSFRANTLLVMSGFTGPNIYLMGLLNVWSFDWLYWVILKKQALIMMKLLLLWPKWQLLVLSLLLLLLKIGSFTKWMFTVLFCIVILNRRYIWNFHLVLKIIILILFAACIRQYMDSNKLLDVDLLNLSQL